MAFIDPQTEGPISIGTAGGAARSLNRTRARKRTTGDTDGMPMSVLREWYRTYTQGGTGNAAPGSDGDRISFSDFEGKSVYAAHVRVRNETYDAYATDDNGGISVMPLYGSSVWMSLGVPAFNVNINGDEANVGFNQWHSHPLNLNSDTAYAVTIRDIAANLSFSLSVKPGYNGSGGLVTGSTGTSALSFTPKSQTSSGWSGKVLFFAGTEDLQGTRYGTV